MKFNDSQEGVWFRQLLENGLVERPGKPMAINATVVTEMCRADPKSAQAAMQLLAQQLNENLQGRPVTEVEDIAQIQRLVLGTLFHSYCVAQHFETGTPLDSIPKELHWILERYPIILECMRFVSESNATLKQTGHEKNEETKNTNIQSIDTKDDSTYEKGKICEVCKKRPGKIEHRISPPMKIVEVCLCDECSRNVVY